MTKTFLYDSIDSVEKADKYEKDYRKLSEPYKLRQVIKSKKIGRNDPCPCGSEKKYKNVLP